jgi:WD40 repeat protein/tRNA A-37 threonylcarbamoyl transferase component Bud32
MWAATLPPKARPGQTLKGPAQTVRPEAGVVVRQRTLSDASRKTTTMAGPAASDYQLLEMLGEGGMGQVYLARQMSMDRQIALKKLKPNLATDGVQRSKFLAEAVITGDLDHPNIVPIHDLGASDDGTLFYAMKRVRGTPWFEVMNKKSLAENLTILMRVADAVAFAHARNVIHRDLKPENVMLGDFGEVLVMDWGLAMPIRADGTPDSDDEGEATCGTPVYMPPEMAAGPLASISYHSDVYLLGAILYELVTGFPPHHGENVMSCLFAAADNKIHPTDKTGELVDIALKAMEARPEDRYRDVRAFQAAIRDYQSHSESVLLASHAAQQRERAIEARDRDLMGRALYGFQEALSVWSGNTTAAEGVVETQRDLGQLAFDAGDYDYAVSVLRADEPRHQPLRQQAQKAIQTRESQLSRVRWLQRISAVLAVLIVLGSLVAALIINQARSLVQEERDNALKSAQAEREAKLAAEESEKEASDARAEAETNLQLSIEREREAQMARAQEAQARAAAEDAEMAERAAKLEALHEGYRAKIGLAAAKVDANAFGQSMALLQTTPESLRNWEWDRLNYLNNLPLASVAAHPPRAEQVRYVPGSNGTQAVSAGWDMHAKLWDLSAAEPALIRSMPSEYKIRALDVSPDGKFIATGNDAGILTLWNLASGVPLWSAQRHTSAILTMKFSPDGSQLATGGSDFSVMIWDLTTREPRLASRQTYWVWDLAFSADGRQLLIGTEFGDATLFELEADPKSSAQPPAPRRVWTAALGRDNAIFSVLILPNGKQVLLGTYSGRIAQVDSGSGEVVGVFSGHSAGVRSLSLSPDGNQLVTSGNDNTIMLWDLQSGRSTQTLRGHSASVTAAEFSPDGSRVISSAEDGTIKLWLPAETRETVAFERHTGPIRTGGLTADGRLAITGSQDGTARLWNTQSAEERASYVEAGHTGVVSAAAATPDGSITVTAGVDHVIRVWETASGRLIESRDAGEATVRAVSVSPDGKLVALGDESGLLRVWDRPSDDLITYGHGPDRPTHPAPILAVSLAAEGRNHLVAGYADGRTKFWDLDSPEKFTFVVGDPNGQPVIATSILPKGLYSKTPECVLVAYRDNVFTVWNLANGERVFSRTHQGQILSGISVTADGKRALAATFDDTNRKAHLWLWDLVEGQVVWQTGDDTPEPHHVNTIAGLALLPDGKTAYTAGLDRKLLRWDLEAGTAEQLTSTSRAFRLFATQVGERVVVQNEADVEWRSVDNFALLSRMGQQTVVSAAAISADGSTVVTGTLDGRLKLWQAEPSEMIGWLAWPENVRVLAADFSPDGQQLVASGEDGVIRLYGVSDRTLVRTFAAEHQGPVVALDFGVGRVLSGGHDGKARLWDPATGESLKTLSGHLWFVLGVALSPDGKRALTGSQDNTARLWDVETGETIVEFAGHTDAVNAVAFLNSERIVTGSADSTAKIWDTSEDSVNKDGEEIAGEELLTLRAHGREVTLVAVSPEQQLILTGSRDGTALIWPADLSWTPGGEK